jgi:hypothetical protein
MDDNEQFAGKLSAHRDITRLSGEKRSVYFRGEV